MNQRLRPRRTVRFPPAPAATDSDVDDGGSEPIVSVFGLPSRTSTEGPHARAIIQRAVGLSQATGDPIEIDLDELEAAAATDAALPLVPVVVSSLWIEDGSVRPAVGDIVDQVLRFVEINDPDDGGTHDWDVTVEPVDLPHPTGPEASPGPGAPSRRSALVHGPGWTAAWPDARDVSGPTRLRGVLIIDFDVAPTGPATLARISRLWVTTVTVDRPHDDPDAPPHIVPGSQQLRPVTISPRWFDHGHGRPDERPPPAPPRPGERFIFADRPDPATPYVRETGVLLELDLVPDRQPDPGSTWRTHG